jgi:signal transduction histidine kinase
MTNSTNSNKLNSRLIYSFFLSGLGFVLIVFNVVRLSANLQNLSNFLLLLILAVLVQVTMTYVINRKSSVSVDTAISLATISLYGFNAAVLVAAASAFGGWLITLRVDKPDWKHALERLGVNMGMHSTAMLLAGIVFEWLTRELGGNSIIGDTVPWFVSALIADQTNLWLLIGIIYLAHGVKPFDTWRENLWAIPINVLVMAVGGGLLAFSVRAFGALGIVGFFLPIALSAYAYRYIVWNAKKQMGELEELVALRTQALADANDELANLQKEKDSFLAVLTHDMRTPLTSIQGYATILGSQRVEDDQQMQMGRIILRNGETLLDIVNNMLEIEQMKAGMPVTLERSQFDLARLAERTVEAIQSQAMEKDINLQCHVTEPPVLIDGDEKKIERVLLNLTSNAIKYTQREGCVEIAVQMNGRYAILEVSDNGYGIPADEVDHIFDSYRRVKDHQHIALGTGLGLAIVKSLVEAHEGKIDVASEVDKGSIFTVKLPLPEMIDQ